MNREQIINEFTTNLNTFQKLARNIAGPQDADDLFQECTLMLLEFSEERLISYYNPTQGLKPFFLRMLINQYRSKTSKFHKEYRKQEQFIQKQGAAIVYNEQATEIETNEPELKDMEKARDNVHILNGEMFPNEMENMVFFLYTETGSLRKTLAAIPHDTAHLFDLKTVHTIVKKYRRTIKTYLGKAA
jgi:DNA-directed RNA polymerase specialized sigma24 family protein